VLEELDRVLGYPKLRRYYTEEERTRPVALLMALSEVVDLPETIPRICRDPDDDRVIACAVAGEADVIVSGDADLLTLERVRDILVLSPAEMLMRIERKESEHSQEERECLRRARLKSSTSSAQASTATIYAPRPLPGGLVEACG
jgi:predicted nucleic acid-binding protein